MKRKVPELFEGVADSNEVDDKSRFLKKRTKKNSESNYHPSHNEKYVAEIPDFQTGEVLDEDKEVILMIPPKREVEEDDIKRFKEEITNLPIDVAFQILSFYEYDVDTTIEVARQMAVPDLMTNFAKNVVVANIPFERDAKSTRKVPYKKFYCEKMFRNRIDPKTLVNFYYNEKNKIGGNWRLEQDNCPQSDDKMACLKEIMLASNINILRRDAGIPRKRSYKDIKTRMSSRSQNSSTGRLPEPEQQVAEKSSEEANTITPIAAGRPESFFSAIPRSSGSSTLSTASQPRINMKIRFTPSKLNTPSQDISIITSPLPPETFAASKSDLSSTSRKKRQRTKSKERPNPVKKRMHLFLL